MAIVQAISAMAVPVMFFTIVLFGVIRRIDVFDNFMIGAKEGLEVYIKIIPALIGLLVGINMFQASGAMDIIIWMVKPVTSFLNIPSEVVPLALMRPISGSGSLAIVSDLIHKFGPDSFVGRITSVMMGSTETTFYTLTIYFGATCVTKTRYTLKAALLGDLATIMISVMICRMFFGG